MAKTKKIIIIVAAVIAVILLLSLISSTMYSVGENQFGIVRQFGQVVDIKNDPGLYFKVPFVQEIDYLPKNTQLYDVTPSDVLTSDKKSLVVDSYAIWKIVDPLEFVQSIGTLGEMEGRLDAATYSVVKNTLGTMIQTDIIMAGSDTTNYRNELNKIITDRVNEQVKNEYGVEIVAIEVKKLDLPSDNEAAVYERMISDRKQMAAAYIAEGDLEASKIKNDTDKEAAITVSEAKAKAETLKGEAEAKYMQILAGAYSSSERQDFYSFYRSLETAKTLVKDDGSGNMTLILPKDSELAKIFIGNN